MNRVKFYSQRLKSLLTRAVFLLALASVTYSIHSYFGKFEASLSTELQRLREINQKIDRFLAFQSQITKVALPDTSHAELKLSQFLDKVNSLFPEFKLTLEQKQTESSIEKIPFRISGEGSIHREVSLLEFLNTYEYPIILTTSYSFKERESSVLIEISGVIALVK